MRRDITATVVALVGAPPGLLASITAANVAVVDAAHASDRARSAAHTSAPGHDASPDPLSVAEACWTKAVRVRRPYVLHDADPLAVVAAAWVARSEGGGVPGELEVAAASLRASVRAGRVELPDTYLVAAPEALTPTWRHWYLGVMHAAAASRVVPVAATDDGVLRTLAALPAGRWWPPLDELLGSLDRLVPDALHPGRSDAFAPTGLGGWVADHR